MNEQEKIKLLLQIETSNSKQWKTQTKQEILRKSQTDKDFLFKVRQAFVSQQLKDVENDPLEDKVFDHNGKLVANRDWKCKGHNCSYRFHRANAPKLKIEVRSEDSKNLMGTNFVCLKHYYVHGQEKNYCHSYFKLHKKLPEGAFLKIKLSNSDETQPEKSLVTKPKTTLLNHPIEVQTNDVSEEQNQAGKRFNFKFYLGSFINDDTQVGGSSALTFGILGIKV